MSNGYAIIELSNGCQFRLHLIDVPKHTEKGWYTAVSSAEGFKRRMRKRHNDLIDKTGSYAAPTMHFIVKLRSDFDAERAIEYDHGVAVRYRGGTVQHANIFEFYKHIGFDYKKNRFIQGQANGSKNTQDKGNSEGR